MTLSFSSSCQIMPYIVDRRASQVVHPRGGGWGCLTVITALTLNGGESKEERVEIMSAETAAYP